VFIAKGIVGRFKVIGDINGGYEVLYEVYINVYGCTNNKVATVSEKFLAPDTTQLGVNVTNRYYVSGNI